MDKVQLSTGMVDNYMLHVFPFLAIILFERWELLIIFAILSLTSTVNVLFESTYTLSWLKAVLPAAILKNVRWYDSLFNTAVIVFWLGSLFAYPLVRNLSLHGWKRAHSAQGREAA